MLVKLVLETQKINNKNQEMKTVSTKAEEEECKVIMGSCRKQCSAIIVWIARAQTSVQLTVSTTSFASWKVSKICRPRAEAGAILYFPLIRNSDYRQSVTKTNWWTAIFRLFKSMSLSLWKRMIMSLSELNPILKTLKREGMITVLF